MENDSARVLVVDGTRANREILVRRLMQQGHRPEPAQDGEQALQMLDAGEYDLVLLDIMMPKVDGYAVLERVKADARFQHLPVIMISALDEIDSIVRCLKIGADDYVTKPFDPILLEARVGACLAKKRVHDQEQALTRQLQDFNETLERRVAEATADLAQRLKELTALTEVSTAINSVMDVNLILERILDLSKEVMTAEASSLLVLDREIGKLRFHVTRGMVSEALTAMTVELGQGIAGWVAQTGEPLLIPDAYQDARFDRSYDEWTGFRTRSILTVPITSKDEVAGVVQVINKKGVASFDEHDLRLFQSFAGMASAAFENARLFEQTRQMADDLRDALEAERRLAIEKEKRGAYIPKQVVDEISRNREQKLALGGKLVEATILFSDIQGFTRLAETMKPEAVVSFLNEYMTAMTRIIEDENGIVDKFIGDGIMAVFLVVDEADAPALRAVRSGIRMQQQVAELRRGWQTNRPELTDLQVRVGINTGEVVSGNIGSETRMDYTVVGDNVNVTSRIESSTRAGGVHISEATYLEVKESVAATRLDPITVKNRVQPVLVYAVHVPDTPPAD